jgi:hypothetical protein
MHKEQREMLHVYLANGLDRPSTVKLRNMLPKFADDLHRFGKKEITNVGSTTREIQDLKDRKDTLLFLLWAIPEKMLLAILRHTVPIDFFNVPEPILEYKQAPGIYLVTIEIKGRDGRFLNSDEIVRAVGLLKQYGIAAEHLHKFLANAKQDFPSTLAGKDILLQQHFASRTSSRAGTRPAVQHFPRQIKLHPRRCFSSTKPSHSSKRWTIQRCIGARMRVWCITILVTEVPECRPWKITPRQPVNESAPSFECSIAEGSVIRDTPSTKHMPTRLRCTSGDLEMDTSKHTATRIPSNINENLQLMLRTILFMGLDAELKVSVVLRTWKAEQLQVAEQLVIVLGRTVVWQDGLNSEAGGGTPGHDIGDHLQAAEDYVMLSDWFKLNVAASEAEVMAARKAAEAGKAVFEAAQRDIVSMTISRKRRQEIADLTSAFPEAVSGSLNEVADLFEARLTRCKVEMLKDLKHVFGRALSALEGEMREDDAPPAGSL